MGVRRDTTCKSQGQAGGQVAAGDEVQMPNRSSSPQSLTSTGKVLGPTSHPAGRRSSLYMACAVFPPLSPAPRPHAVPPLRLAVPGPRHPQGPARTPGAARPPTVRSAGDGNVTNAKCCAELH